VLNGGRSADDSIASRVRAAAAALNFRPNPSAQALRRVVSTVGVVVPDLANPYFAEVLKGIHEAAEAMGQRVVVADAGERPAEEVRLARQLAHWGSGVILCSPRMPERELMDLVAGAGQLVTVNRHGRGVPGVVVDFAAGVRDLCAHLRELGHHHVAYLQGTPHAWSDRERRRALRAETRRGMRIDIVPAGTGITDGYVATETALRTGATALLAFSDFVALGVLLRADELGMRVPDDFSLTGFDDIPVAAIAGPGLTTVTVDKCELGRCAHALLRGSHSTEVQRLHPRLVVRGSTATPSARPALT
jgi:LacI family transcriptional regulator